jgi:hypothetical protein
VNLKRKIARLKGLLIAHCYRKVKISNGKTRAQNGDDAKAETLPKIFAKPRGAGVGCP